MKVFAIALTLSLGILVAGCGSDDAEGTADTFTIKGAVGAATPTALIAFGSPSGSNKIGSLSASCPTCSGSPTSFKMTLYQAWISTNADCSSPVLVQDHGAAGSEVDLSTSPTLFSGTPPDGNYPCLIIVASDNLKYRVDAVAVAAHPGCADTTTEYTHDVYREGESDDGAWIDLNGNSIDATGSKAAPGDDKATFFATTDTTTVVAGPGSTSAHTNQTVLLTSALVVPGTVVLRQDFTDGITNSSDGGMDFCVLEDGSMGFE